ncbi:MAG: ATP-binding cassette domain-containing protein [Rhodospirillales bacterium]|nr:ATP-binding cassette domain-containing protein [Rhodospirillales bacterium]
MRFAALAWLRPFLRPVWSMYREIMALSLFVNLLALAVPVFVMQVYDRVVFHAGIETLKGLVIGMACILLFDWILRQSRARILQRVALRLDVCVGRSLYEKLMALPLTVLESRPATYWQTLFRDTDVIRNTLSGAAALMVCDLPFAVLFFVLIFFIAEPVAWLLVFLLPVFMLVAWRSGRVLIANSRDERESGLGRDRLIADVIAGRETVKALALDASIRPLWEARHAECIERAIRRGAESDTYSNIGTFLTMAGTVAMTALGASFIIDQQMTIGALIAANMLTGRLLGVFNQLIGMWRGVAAFTQSASRLAELFAAPAERQTSGLKLDRPQGVLAIENVSFAYSPVGRPAIDGITVSFKPGGVCGLIGANGSGKSTLLKLMQGLYRPSAGRVLLDGADVTQFTRAELAGWIGYVPQECVLFAGTIRANIANHCPEASDDDILAAATIAGVHAAIVDLPDGYASDIGEGGRRLSAGQRQRIAIARALLGDPPVLLMDEPTSSLDSQATLDIRALLSELGKQRTVVVVTHSTQILPICRTIVCLEKGRLWCAGPSEQVLSQVLGQRMGAIVPSAPPDRATVAPGGAVATGERAAGRRSEAAR